MAERLRFELKGKPENEGRIAIADFTHFLGSVSAALTKIEQDLGAGNTHTFQIVDLAYSSAVLEVESVLRKTATKRSAPVLATYRRAVVALQEGRPLPKGLRPETIQEIATVAKPLGSSVSAINIGGNGRVLAVTPALTERAARLVRSPVATVGELSGFVDAVNVHSELIFYLYPSGFSERTACFFNQADLDRVRAAVKRYATVRGRMLYPPNRLFPSRIDVDELELHPHVDELPTLTSLIGAAPDLTDGVESVAYVRRLRDARR